MKLTVLALSLCRKPAFSIDEKLENVWPALKRKIQQASPSFYAQIAAVEANQICALPKKIQFTIWKYFNRAKFRATPFGEFASFSVIPVRQDNEKLIIASKIISHGFTNWKVKEHLFNGLKASFQTAELLFSNTSIYYANNQVRYLCLKDGIFEIAAVENFPELNSMVSYCASKRSKADIYGWMKNEHQLTLMECKSLILQLLSLQLLHSSNTPNISGEDYFNRIGYTFDDNDPYILAERKLLAGGLCRYKTLQITEALVFLAQHLPNSENGDMRIFKNSFKKKFEYQQISLAMIMDPELGLGYGNLAQYEKVQELVGLIEQKASEKVSVDSIVYGDLHRFLINAIARSEAIDLQSFKSTSKNANLLPNSLSVLCHFYNGKPVIANAGGCTANALIGRFTLASETLAAHSQYIARIEQDANPDVVFFDIAYQAESLIDNVNRRKSCYSHELPILTWSCLAEPLDFNDVSVSMQGDEVILYSKKLSKRLVPRIASAYNYNRSDLAVYRFLCDLQHQSIQSSLNFDFQNLLPGLNHYPRVVYKDVILSTAKWLIPAELYQQKSNVSKEDLIELKAWLKLKKINFFFKIAKGDQTLCFNPKSIADLTAMVNYCRQQSDRPIYLAEALIDELGMVQDENGKKYNAEFVINFAHQQQLYHPAQLSKLLAPVHQPAAQRFYLPGSEWLYFEIYLPASRSNALLCFEIQQLLKIYKADILKWFFIRYDENGKHLRIRLKVMEVEKRALIIKHLNALLLEPVTRGKVADFQMKTYYPELGRYGADRMVEVEQFFYLDSKYVLSLLSKISDKNVLYQQAINFIYQMTNVCFDQQNDCLQFIKEISSAFAMEFQIDQAGFKKINQAYTLAQMVPLQSFKLKQMGNQASIIFKQCSSSERPQLLADLIHMHLNRLFDDNQRLHEAICYQFTYKKILTIRALVAAQVERQALA